MSPAKHAMAAASARRGERRASRSVSMTKASSMMPQVNIVRSVPKGRVPARQRRRKRRRGDGHPISPVAWIRSYRKEPLDPPVRWDAGGAPRLKLRRLLCRLLGGYNRYKCSSGTFREVDAACAKREERMVFAHADVGARVHLGAALADKDVAGNDAFATELLHAETPAVRVTTVARRAACLFVSHGETPELLAVCSARRRFRNSERYCLNLR
ncbi:hypothetical protein CHELA20_53409 [Hyphomicrobiales bacterium]|nr:hypothetical protein CHELA41_21520 [Hyphomicrobiales bacterium]CAH1684192.1 hypothetical protein CHELA20_53409 [Hyphomicrobiales bacterium]